MTISFFRKIRVFEYRIGWFAAAGRVHQETDEEVLARLYYEHVSAPARRTSWRAL